MPHDAIAIPMNTKETRAPWMTAATKQKATVGVVTAVSTIGISAVLVLWGFPWMMKLVNSSQEFSQNKLVEVIERQIVSTERATAATVEQTKRIDDQTERVDDLCSSHGDLCKKLDELIEVQREAAK